MPRRSDDPDGSSLPFELLPEALWHELAVLFSRFEIHHAVCHLELDRHQALGDVFAPVVDEVARTRVERHFMVWTDEAAFCHTWRIHDEIFMGTEGHVCFDFTLNFDNRVEDATMSDADRHHFVQLGYGPHTDTFSHRLFPSKSITTLSRSTVSAISSRPAEVRYRFACRKRSNLSHMNR